VFDFFLNFIEKIGVNNSLIPGSIGFLFKTVDFGYLLIVLVQYLLDVVFNFLYLFLEVVRFVLLLVSLYCLHLVHLAL
jgi:hypothetical protein